MTLIQHPSSINKKARNVEELSFKPFFHRAFLNVKERESNAFVSVGLKSDGWEAYTIKITDCENQILLHGGLHKRASRKNAMYKINTMIHALTRLKEEMKKEFERLNVKY